MRETVISLVVVFLTATLVGCKTAPQQVHLDYTIADKGSAPSVLHGRALTIAPFADARASKMIGRNMVMQKGHDAGVLLANAIKLEVNHAGGAAQGVADGVRPSSGYHMHGSVNVIESIGTGWQSGGLIGMLSKAGVKVHLNVATVLFKDGIQYKTHTYDFTKKIPKTFGENMFTATDIPGSIEYALQALIRTRIMADLQRDLTEELRHDET